MFEFIKAGMEEVSYPRFFLCTPLTKDEQRRVNSLPILPASYREFLGTFGQARFFRELERDNHHLLVIPPDEEINRWGNDYMVEVGWCNHVNILFKYDELEAGREPPVYDVAVGVGAGGARKRADCFMEWLEGAWKRCRRKYNKRTWEKVLAGPEPFTPEEERIVEIRRGFSWKQLPSENGMLVIEFTNGSKGRLRYYSIGVRSNSRGETVGGYRLDVSRLEPGTTQIIYQSVGYEGFSAERAMLFEKGEPKPETRGEYWELGRGRIRAANPAG